MYVSSVETKHDCCFCEVLNAWDWLYSIQIHYIRSGSYRLTVISSSLWLKHHCICRFKQNGQFACNCVHQDNPDIQSFRLTLLSSQANCVSHSKHGFTLSLLTFAGFLSTESKVPLDSVQQTAWKSLLPGEIKRQAGYLTTGTVTNIRR